MGWIYDDERGRRDLVLSSIRRVVALIEDDGRSELEEEANIVGIDGDEVRRLLSARGHNVLSRSMLSRERDLRFRT